ncbi:MAG: MobF family relaxase, partial [Gemmataceae bacterium]
MLSISAFSPDQGNYYIALARDDYYLNGGEPPGQWLGKGAEHLGLTEEVDKTVFKRLLRGFSPDGAQPLVQGAGGSRHQAGWDLTFTSPKSVSAIWSQADPVTRRAIQEAQTAAVREAVDYLQDAAALTRRGRGGQAREPTKLVVATFEHGTSRAQDPHLHTHCLVLNVGVREDGTTGTILSRPLYTHKLAAGAVYRAELANQLEKRLGVKLERKKSWFEVQGVPEALADEFSTRRGQIEQALADYGAFGAKAAAKFTLATRPTKGHQPRAELLPKWQDVGRQHGFTRENVGTLLGQQADRLDLAARVG